MATERQLAVLKILKDGPKRGIDLYKLYISETNEEMLNGGSPSNYFSTLVDNIAEKGWIHRVASFGNNVWYFLTQDGYYEMLQSLDPAKLHRMIQSKLQRALLTIADMNGREIDWTETSNFTKGLRERLEDSGRRAEELANTLPEEEVLEIRSRVLAVLIAENRMPNRRSAKRTAVIEQIIGDLPPELVMKSEKAAEKKLRQYHKKEGIILDGNGAPRVFGKCFFCGADIVVKEAAEEAELLTRYGGRKGEMVCCGCHNHLQWLEKHLGGEHIAKSAEQ